MGKRCTEVILDKKNPPLSGEWRRNETEREGGVYLRSLTHSFTQIIGFINPHVYYKFTLMIPRELVWSYINKKLDPSHFLVHKSERWTKRQDFKKGDQFCEQVKIKISKPQLSHFVFCPCTLFNLYYTKLHVFRTS